MKRRTAEDRASAAVKTIVFLGLPGTQILDITGPFQVFVRAAEIYRRSHPKQNPPYTVLLASATSSRTANRQPRITEATSALRRRIRTFI